MEESPKPLVKAAPYIAIVVAICAASTAAIFIRYARRDAPALVIAAYRLSIATLIITPLALTRYRAELRRLNLHDLGWALASGVFLGVHFATWISSLDYTTVMISVVLVSTSPLWVALAAVVLWRQRLRRNTVIGLGLAMAGGLAIALGSGESSGAPTADAGAQLWGSFLSLAGAWTVAGYWLIGRNLRARLSTIPYTWLVYGTAALVLWGLVLVVGLPVVGFPAETYLLFVLLAILPQLFGHSMFNYALAHLSAVYVSVATLGEPLGSTVLAMLLLGEIPSITQAMGGALILGGIFLVSREEQAADG